MTSRQQADEQAIRDTAIEEDPGRAWFNNLGRISRMNEDRDCEVTIAVRVTLDLIDWALLGQVARNQGWTLDETISRALTHGGGAISPLFDEDQAERFEASRAKKAEADEKK